MSDKIPEYFSGKLTDEERYSLFEQMQYDESLKRELISLKRLQSYSQLIPQPSDRQDGKKSFALFSKKYLNLNKRSLFINVLRYAALAAIIIGLSIFSYYNINTSNKEIVAIFNSSEDVQEIKLKDGTAVWLNTNSSMEHPFKFSKKERRVYVTGEAYFDVVEDNRKPFVVVLDEFKIKVLGTQFGVKSNPEQYNSYVTLVEGSVEVRINDNIYDLTPGHQLEFNKEDGTVKIREVKTLDYTWWKDGVYSFKSIKLEEVLKVAEEWFDVEFEYVNKRAKDIIFNGALLKSEDIDSFLSRIEATSSCRFVKQNNIIKIY